MKGWIGFDLDGTLAEYKEWKGPTHIGKPLKPAIAKLKQHLANGDEVRIFTARVHNKQASKIKIMAEVAIKAWCLKNIGTILPITCEKDWELIKFYDDRAVQVEFNTGRILPTQKID